jgi:hypothetical protein
MYRWCPQNPSLNKKSKRFANPVVLTMENLSSFYNAAVVKATRYLSIKSKSPEGMKP